MSVHVTSWVWKQIIGDPEAKLVLLKLADQANDDGECWPSRRTIAAATETSISTVSRSVTYLVDRGFLTVVERARTDGGRTSNLYRFPRYINTDPPGLSDPPPGPTAPPPGSPGDPAPGSAVTRHEPSSESSLNQGATMFDRMNVDRDRRRAEEANAPAKTDQLDYLQKLREETGL